MIFRILFSLKKDEWWVVIHSEKKFFILFILIILFWIIGYITHWQIVLWWGISLFFLVLFRWLDERIFFIFALMTLITTIYYLLIEKKDLAEYFAILTYYGIFGGVTSTLLTPLVQKYIVSFFPHYPEPSWWNDYIKELRFYMSILRLILPVFLLGVLLFSFLDFWVQLQFDKNFLTSISGLIVFSQFFPEYKLSKNKELSLLFLITLLSSGLLLFLLPGNIFLQSIFILLFITISILWFFCRDSVKKFAHRVFSL